MKSSCHNVEWRHLLFWVQVLHFMPRLMQIHYCLSPQSLTPLWPRPSPLPSPNKLPACDHCKRTPEGRAAVWLADRLRAPRPAPCSSNKNKPCNRLNRLTPLCQHQRPAFKHTAGQTDPRPLLLVGYNKGIKRIGQSQAPTDGRLFCSLEAVSQWNLNETCLNLPPQSFSVKIEFYTFWKSPKTSWRSYMSV